MVLLMSKAAKLFSCITVSPQLPTSNELEHERFLHRCQHFLVSFFCKSTRVRRPLSSRDLCSSYRQLKIKEWRQRLARSTIYESLGLHLPMESSSAPLES